MSLLAGCGPSRPMTLAGRPPAPSASVMASAETGLEPPPRREDVDALLAKGTMEWAEARDEASRRSLRAAGQGLARLGEKPTLEVVWATDVPLVVGPNELVVPVCFQYGEDCALVDARVSEGGGGAPRRLWITGTRQRSNLPLRLRSAGGLPFILFNEEKAWLYSTIDRAIDLGVGVQRAEVGTKGVAALVVQDRLRLIDMAVGLDLLTVAQPADAFFYQYWPKDGVWFASCSPGSGEHGFVIEAETGAVLFQEEGLSACALDASTGLVAFVRKGESSPVLRTWSVVDKKARATTPVIGSKPDEDLTLRLDEASHVVGIRYEPYRAAVVSYGNYDIRTLIGVAAPKKKAPANPIEGLPVGSKYEDTSFPEVAPFAKLSTSGHEIMTSYVVPRDEGYHWTGGRSADGKSALLLEDSSTPGEHDRALLILDATTGKVRARVPIHPTSPVFAGDWEIAMFLDDHTIVVRSNYDEWLIDADTAAILFSFGTPDDANFIVPKLLPNGILAQAAFRGLDLFDLGTAARPTTPPPWEMPQWLAPTVGTGEDGEWTTIGYADDALFIKRTGEIEKTDGSARRPAVEREIPPWILCRVGDALYPVAVCQGAFAK